MSNTNEVDIAADIERRRRERATQTNGFTTSRLIDRSELATRWGVHINTIRNMQRRGELTAVRLGPRTVRYSLAQVIEIETHRKP